MGEESLYRVVDTVSSGNNHKVWLLLNKSHQIYEGHFPENPVLPGVCTLQIIKECLGNIIQKEIRYKNIAMCKFTSVIQPSDDCLEISFVLKEDNTFLATVQIKEMVMLKLKANFVEL